MPVDVARLKRIHEHVFGDRYDPDWARAAYDALPDLLAAYELAGRMADALRRLEGEYAVVAEWDALTKGKTNA